MADLLEVDESLFFKIPPLMIIPNIFRDFEVYLKLKRNKPQYMLYCKDPMSFTVRHREKLFENGVDELYVRVTERDGYHKYIEENLPKILDDESIDVTERGKVFYSATTNIIEETFENRLPGTFKEEHYKRISDMIGSSIPFLTTSATLKTLQPLINKDYYTYSHSINTMIYFISLLTIMSPDYTRAQLEACATGAVLHDIGKCRMIDLVKKEGPLTPEEWVKMKTHPSLGNDICENQSLSIPQITRKIIRQHHEKLDGKGYPSMLKEEDISKEVRAMTICDIYDAITTKRSYKDAKTPFQALQILSTMRGQIDMDILIKFIKMLNDNNICEVKK